jgi:hypothetical protein
MKLQHSPRQRTIRSAAFRGSQAAAKPRYGGEREVFGFKTVATQTGQRVGDDFYSRSEWRAPDLDCMVLRVVEERRDARGNITGHFGIEAAKLILGAPDPKPFEVPDVYTEMSPSPMYAAVVRATAFAAGTLEGTKENIRRRLERKDQEYRKNHEAAGRKD